MGRDGKSFRIWIIIRRKMSSLGFMNYKDMIVMLEEKTMGLD